LLLAVNVSDEHYFEVLADDVISKEQDPHVSGFTSDSWIALNSLGSHERAKVDDRHNHTPVGEVLSTGMSRDLAMASAQCVIRRNSPLAIKMSDKVKRGDIKSVSVEYQTHKNSYTGRKEATRLLYIGLHPDPYNKRCLITRSQGAGGGDVESWAVPGRIVANPSSQGTKI